MQGYILYIGYLSLVGILTPLPDVGNVYMPTKSLCEQTAIAPSVVDSYRSIVEERYPDREFRIWCEPTRKQ